MKQKHVVLGIVAQVLVTIAPVAGQEIPQPVVVAQSESKEKEPEKPEQEVDKKAEKKAEKKARQNSEQDWGFRWTDHPSLRLGPGTHVDVRARVQGNLQNSDVSISDEESDSSIDMARRRVGIEGEILNLFDYQVEAELGASRDPWRDVYLNYKQFDVAHVLAGKFKVPFSLDENTSATKLDFVHRSRIATLLAPGRDIGVMVHGRVLPRGWLRYELGVFNEDGSNARTHTTDRVHGERTVAARALVQPFRSTKSLASDLAFGVAFTTSELPEGVSDIRGRTELDAAFYVPAVVVSGQRQRIGFEARWRPGPFSVKSEYIRLSDERLGQSVDNTDLSPFVSSGWYVSGTWAVTGEKKADGLDTPRRPLFQGGIGAVELAVRVERIRFGSGASDPLASNAPRADVILGNGDQAYTFGLNWYANRWIKVQANLVRNTIMFPDQGPLPEQSGVLEPPDSVSVLDVSCQTMKRHPTLLAAMLLTAVALAGATPARAQTTDDLFDPNTLQELRLTINTRDLRNLRANYLENTYYTADLQWRNIRVRNAGVRSRGNASRSDVKLGLRVDFNRYVTGQTFLGLKSFVLKNLWQDPSMMHEQLAMALFRRLGHPAPRESFCRLYINNEFQGLYVIVESVDNAFLTRNAGRERRLPLFVPAAERVPG